MLQVLLIAAFASFATCLCLIKYKHLHEHLTADRDVEGVQKFHAVPVPRVGGVPIGLGVFCGMLALMLLSGEAWGWWLLLSAVPAFGAGLLEDVTKSIGPLPRLLATFVAALLASYLLGANLNRIGILSFDVLLQQHAYFAIILTIVAVGGVAHAVNIIDGYNGLSAGTAVIIFLALAYVSFKVHDITLLGISFAMIGSLLGFLFWNFPRGLIFAGDGGAYLIGFLIAEIAVLLVVRYPQVSPWFPLLCVIYPVFETLFSIYRRKFLQGRAVGRPDALHLHQLVYRRLVLWMIGSREARHLTQRNSMTSPCLWVLSSVAVAPAMLFWNNTPVLMGLVLGFIALYVLLYRMIVRFKAPKWLRIRGTSQKS